MTSKKLDLEKLLDLENASKEVLDKKALREKLRKDNKKLEEKSSKLREQINEISKSFPKRSYSEREKKYLLTNYGVLTAINNKGEHTEANIVSYNGEILEVDCNFGYNTDSVKTVELPINGLLDKGYVSVKGGWVVDDIKNPEDVINIILEILKQEKAFKLRDKKWREEGIAKYQQELDNINIELKSYTNVSDDKIQRTFNNISFGMTDIKIETILKALPREVKV